MRQLGGCPRLRQRHQLPPMPSSPGPKPTPPATRALPARTGFSPPPAQRPKAAHPHHRPDPTPAMASEAPTPPSGQRAVAASSKPPQQGLPRDALQARRLRRRDSPPRRIQGLIATRESGTTLHPADPPQGRTASTPQLHPKTLAADPEQPPGAQAAAHRASPATTPTAKAGAQAPFLRGESCAVHRRASPPAAALAQPATNAPPRGRTRGSFPFPPPE